MCWRCLLIAVKFLVTILGVDPGTNKLGYGILAQESGKLALIDYGCLVMESAKARNYSNLSGIYATIESLIKKHKPNQVAVEKIFFQKNIKTALAVSEARGVILLAASKAGVEIKEFTPLEVKQAVSSYGRAGKKEVQKMVRLILNLKEDPQPDDAADALAVAICCAQTRF